MEPGPAVQQADALTIEPRRTLIVNKGNFHKFILTENLTQVYQFVN
jgi:hypothetical protein